MPVSFTLNRVTSFRPLTGDQDGDGYADAGDVLRHTLTIHNTGDTDALNVVVNDLLGGSTETGLMNISPIAFNDAFTAVGNTALRVGGAANIGSGPSSVVAGNLLANDVGSTTVGVGALAADDVTGFTIDTVTNGSPPAAAHSASSPTARSTISARPATPAPTASPTRSATPASTASPAMPTTPPARRR